MAKKENQVTLMDTLHTIAKEYDIDEYEFLDKFEQALAPKYERVLGLVNACRVTLNTEDGTPYVYELVPVGDLDPETGEAAEYEEVDVTPKTSSRLIALEAKNIVNQIIREARRDKIVEEYIGRKGECVTGEVQQVSSAFTIIKLRENLEAELPAKEQPANERYSRGERLKVYILDAKSDKNSGGYSITVSRTHQNLIKRLFEIEIPEVEDGTVEIKNIARDPGSRSKVAVYSREPGLDPVGACVGPKGSRVRVVVQDLRNERIDIIPWSEDSATYIKSALSPARVERVLINEDSHTATVIVANDQLSLAIGKEGQNARLAAKLTGWRIDIKSIEMASEAGLIERSAAQTMNMDDLSEIDTRCSAVNAEGVRCRNHARPGSQFCGVHDKEGAEA